MPWPYLRVGNTAKIEEGPLRGVTGIVVKIKSALKLVLSIELLQRSIAVEIDRNWITPCSPAELRRQSTARARSIVDLADPAQPQSDSAQRNQIGGFRASPSGREAARQEGV